MLKRKTLIGCFACVFGLATLSHAQAIPTASRNGSLQLGVGGSYSSTDYTQKGAEGFSIYGDYNFFRNIGIEGDIHLTNIRVPEDVGESTYLIGPRYVFHYKRFEPYGKVLFGLGRINYQFDYEPHYSASYFTYAFGGGLDVHATRHINVRAFDFEYQKWNYPPNGLSPYVMTIGAAYTFH
jgi:Outer membrane protein beta-barrel domain